MGIIAELESKGYMLMNSDEESAVYYRTFDKVGTQVEITTISGKEHVNYKAYIEGDYVLTQENENGNISLEEFEEISESLAESIEDITEYYSLKKG